MTRTFLLLLTAACALQASAQLAPTTPAPLSAHLREVNAQWSVQDPMPAGGDRIVSFTDDAQRIAEHLHRVRATLAARTPEGLSAGQMKARTTLLEDLDRYADRGRFPQNELLPYRNPIFIDRHHTACAVGQLMIESGDEALAQRISAEMNPGYVAELLEVPTLAQAIGAWASTHGFTADELAWIQPAYSPNYTWNPVGGGTDARVTTLLKLGNNDLLVAGDFTDAGGAACTHVARWNGASYMQLGTGVQGEPVCAAEHNGLLYLGGTFQNFSHDLAVWNGSSWSYANVQPGQAPHVSSLHVHNGELFAGSEASGFAGVTYQAYKLNGGNWVPVGQALNGPLLALETHDGELVAGGAFTGIQSFGQPDTSIMHVAHLVNNQWEQLADGLDNTVNDLLETSTGYLYAGGGFYANVVPTFGLARIAGGTLWEPCMPTHTNYIQQSAGVTEIRALAQHDTTIWFGGSFGIVQLMYSGFNCGRFLGTPDWVEPTALFDASVNALADWNGGMVSGGDFAGNQGLSVPYIAYTELSTGINDRGDAAAMKVWPSPAEGVLHIDAGDLPFSGETVQVVDAAGHAVQQQPAVKGARIDLNVDGLKPGAYWVRVLHDGQVRTTPFVKQ